MAATGNGGTRRNTEVKKLDRSQELTLTDQDTSAFGLLRSKKGKLIEASMDPFDLLPKQRSNIKADRPSRDSGRYSPVFSEDIDLDNEDDDEPF